jgi:uncharacterized protein
MKKIATLLFAILSLSASAQQDSSVAANDILQFQKNLNAVYKNREESPLEPKDFKKFKGHSFFPINLAYRITARINITPNTPIILLKTTTTRLPEYRVYGYLEFELSGKSFKLPVYQSPSQMKDPEQNNHLFFPFADLTNENQSYTGGRFIDLRIPNEGEPLIVDFNQAYNPYCAYSHKYSCPLVPAENQMDVEIPAGVMHVSH